MSKSMRVFCLLAVIGLIAGVFWLHRHGLQGESFFAACVVYILVACAVLGEVMVPLSKRLPARPYRGETMAQLRRRELEDIQRLYPDSKWPKRYSAILAASLMGFLFWAVLMAALLF